MESFYGVAKIKTSRVRFRASTRAEQTLALSRMFNESCLFRKIQIEKTDLALRILSLFNYCGDCLFPWLGKGLGTECAFALQTLP